MTALVIDLLIVERLHVGSTSLVSFDKDRVGISLADFAAADQWAQVICWHQIEFTQGELLVPHTGIPTLGMDAKSSFCARTSSARNL